MHPVAEHAWNAVPKRLQDAIASGADRARGVIPPQPPVPDVDKQYRLLIGPVNYAGQGYRWARAVETSGIVSARNYVQIESNPFGYEADHQVTWRTSEHSRTWQNSMFDEIKRDYTHVLIEACFPILGGMFGGDVLKQVALIQDAGVRVGIVGHGTDVRLPSNHRANVPDSHFGKGAKEWVRVESIENTVSKNLAIINSLGVPTFVSTPGLLSDLPDAHLLGVVIDTELWANDRPALQRERLRVVHAPTHTHIKGTDLIRPAVQRLAAEGLIEYVELEDVSHAGMPEVFADADIVLDQFRIGDYGVGACEAMASGRLVLTALTSDVRAEVERNAGIPIPIPEVTVNNIEHLLRDITTNRDHYRAIAAAGPNFVRRLHNGDFSRDVLLSKFLEG